MVAKPDFKPGEPHEVVRVALGKGDRFGLVASTHGDAAAYREMLDLLGSMGANRFFHAGDITGEASDPSWCVMESMSPGHYAVQGNHDVLAVGHEHVHEYSEAVEQHAILTARNLNPEARDLLRNAPAKIETPFFCVTHESVAPPYYAKRSKRRRRSHGWDVGSGSDENTAAVCYSRIDRPYLIGSDHAAYAIVGQPSLKVVKPRPGDEFLAPRRCVISIPSVAFSRDGDYDCGGIFGEIGDDGLMNLKFLSIHPASRSPVFQLPA